MASVFSSWMGFNKLGATPEAEEVLNDAKVPTSPIDRTSSATPKAPMQLKGKPWSASDHTDHHREVSEATLNGRMDEYEHNYHASSRPTSLMGFGSEFSHDHVTTVSSGSGGADNDSTWGDLKPSPTKSTTTKKRKLAPPEILVIVKPPPGKQINPLNLQVQLVMPQKRDSSARRASMDSSSAAATEQPTRASTELRRRESIGSTRSVGSEASQTASITSTSSGRRVTPLYNLNYHNILSTTVTDAGTDQKVAKYVKKGIELDGFGTLEPAELIKGVSDLATQSRHVPPPSGKTTVAPLEKGNSNGSAEASSAFFASSAVESAPIPAKGVEPPTSFQAMTPEARGVEGNLGGKLFGKFKKLSLGVRPPSNSTAGSDSTLTVPRVDTGTTSIYSGKNAHAPEVPQLTPGAGVFDGKKTEGYYWTVRKWNRHAPESIHGAAQSHRGVSTATMMAGLNPVLNNVWKRFNLVNRLGGSEIHPPTREIAVRFEWSRNTKKQRHRSKNDGGKLVTSTSQNASRTSVDKVTGESSKRNSALISSKQQHEPSISISASTLAVDPEPLKPASRSSSFLSGTGRRSFDTSAAGSSARGHGHDSDDDSDPEDSETPWTCHLVLGPNTRIPLGSLAPAPHHPKLVGQLAVPFPLPDLSATGLGPDGAGLTREELKDIIIVTCLHLIVRESFGGLARRKSNGLVDTMPRSANTPSANKSNVSGWRLANIPKK